MCPKRRIESGRARRGFTMIEITVAIGVLSLILLGLAATAATSTRGGVMSRQRLRATYLASQMLETLIAGNIPDADIASFDDDDTASAGTYTAGNATDLWGQEIRAQLGAEARGTIQIVDSAADPQDVPAGRVRITITITWPFFGDHRVQMVGVR